MVALTAAQNAVPTADIGAASAVVTFSRSIGAALGVAVFGSLLGEDLAHAIGGAFLWITPVVVGTVLAALLGRPRTVSVAGSPTRPRSATAVGQPS